MSPFFQNNSPRELDETVSEDLAHEVLRTQRGKEIAKSGHPIAIVFIDLVGSTELKEEKEPRDWLGYVWAFIQKVQTAARNSNGVVVKRIGDEVMVTFENVPNAEAFVDQITNDASFTEFAFKIAGDFGIAFHFRFELNLPSDPYGLVVDRCARLLSLAVNGAHLFSEDFVNESKVNNAFINLGEFPLKGFKDRQPIFLRSAKTSPKNQRYLDLIISKLNESSYGDGYKYVSRKFSPEFFLFDHTSKAKPFLLKEMLNIPKCPFSFQSLSSYETKLEIKKGYIGYLVEWHGIVESLKETKDELELCVVCGESDRTFGSADLKLILSFREIAKALEKGELIAFRGVIVEVFLGFTIDYVDLSIPEKKETK